MKKQLSVIPSRREACWAIAYLFFELLALPVILAALSGSLPTPLTSAQLNLAFFAINFVAVAVILRKFLSQALRTPGVLRSVVTALLGLGAYWLCNHLVTALIAVLDPTFSNVNDAGIADMAQQDFLLTCIGTVALVPASEELLFRGVLFGRLYPRSKAAAFAVSTPCFCAVHVVGYLGLYPWGTLALCFLQYIPAGLCLGWAYARSGSILAPIIMHTVINAVGLFLVR